MKCGMVKGSVLGMGLAAAGLFWVFGGRAWDLVSSKAERARQSARAALTSFDDEIELSRRQVAKLDPAIAAGAEAQAKLEESVVQSQNEIKKLEAQVAERGRKVEALRAALDSPSVKRVGLTDGGKDRTARVTEALGREVDSYKQLEKTLAYTQDTLNYRTALVESSLDRLLEMKAKKKALLSKINEIEARHKARVASQQFNEFRVDTSALAEAEKAVGNLDRQENIATRTDELQSELSDDPAHITPAIDSNRDVLREADEIIHRTSAPATASARVEHEV